MLQCLEVRPDQTALELLIEFRARYPEYYSLRQLCTLERRVRAWRREALRWTIAHDSSNRATQLSLVENSEGPGRFTAEALSDVWPRESEGKARITANAATLATFPSTAQSLALPGGSTEEMTAPARFVTHALGGGQLIAAP